MKQKIISLAKDKKFTYLTLRHLAILFSINDQEPFSYTEKIAEELKIHKTTISRSARALISLGLIEQRLNSSENDLRKRFLFLTSSAKKLFENELI